MPKTSVYFFCRDETDLLQEDVVALLKGFGTCIAFYGNCNYWKEHPDDNATLIRHDANVAPSDCDIVIVGYFWPHVVRSLTFEPHVQPLPKELFCKGRRYATVYMDHHDGHKTVSWDAEYRDFDLILRAKLNKRAHHPNNMRAWALGLNRRILKATDNAPPFSQRERRLLVNFGASHPYAHGTRVLAERTVLKELATILPIDRTKDDLSKSHWIATTRSCGGKRATVMPGPITSA